MTLSVTCTHVTHGLFEGVSDFKNVFKCTNKNSSSGRAFRFNRCSFRISNWSCRRLKLSLFLLLFLSSPWTSLFRCSQTLMWKWSNNSTIFDPHTNDSHGLVPSVDESDFFVESYRCNHLLLSLPRNILYHPILAWEDSVDWICEGYFSICTARVSSHSVATLHRWSINACPVRLFFISICRFFTRVCRNFFRDTSLHSSICSCDSMWRHIRHFLIDDCFILCKTCIVGRIQWHAFVITTSRSIRFTTKDVLCHDIDAAVSSSHFSFDWIYFKSATFVCSLTRL